MAQRKRIMRGGEQMNGKTLLGVILVVLGGLFAFKTIGVSLAPVFGLIFPFVLIGLGAIGLRNDKRFVGTAMVVLGVLMLMSKLHGLLLVGAAIGLIALGVYLVNNKNRAY